MTQLRREVVDYIQTPLPGKDRTVVGDGGPSTLRVVGGKREIVMQGRHEMDVREIIQVYIVLVCTTAQIPWRCFALDAREMSTLTYMVLLPASLV